MIPVKIEMTVLVDPESWTANYDAEGATAVRKDVKEWARYLIYGALDNNDITWEVRS